MVGRARPAHVSSRAGAAFCGHGAGGEASKRLLTLQGHRKVDEAVKILLTANSGKERLTMKSGFFESAPVGS